MGAKRTSILKITGGQKKKISKQPKPNLEKKGHQEARI